jgi:hypothetical protein
MTAMDRRRRETLLMLAAVGVSRPASAVPDSKPSGGGDPAGGKLVFENEKLRVIEHAAKPRLGVCGAGLHSHPPHLTVFLTDAKARVTIAGKAPFIAENKAGDVFWDQGGAHAVENLGSRGTRVFLIELKQA